MFSAIGKNSKAYFLELLKKEGGTCYGQSDQIMGFETNKNIR